VSKSDPELEGRIVAHLEEIAEQCASFDRVAGQLGEDGFAAAWSRAGTAEQIDLKGSIERAYEQIVNDLQGLFDLLEADAYERGVAPNPELLLTGSTDGRQEWWKTARSLGIDTARSDTSQSPGRWRRLALYELLDHELATQVIAWTQSRDFLQHAYAHRTEEAGRRVWRAMHSLRSRVDEVVKAVVAIQNR
jgi:hypothetical protein